MACNVGSGNLVWAGQTITFRAEDGIQEDGPTFAEVNETPFGDTDEKWCQGDVVDAGTVTATGIGTIDAVTGAALLTITYPLGEGESTAATRAGNAFITGAPTSTEKNGLNITTVTFRWSAKPTYTPAS